LIVNATDCGVDMDDFEAPAPSPGDLGWVFLAGCLPWSMIDHARAFLGEAPCPVCRGGDLARSRYCLACDRTGRDGRINFGGLPVGSCPDPDWKAEATAYQPAPGLAGGTGKQTKLRRGLRPRKKTA
jgi:hypothetical protein